MRRRFAPPPPECRGTPSSISACVRRRVKLGMKMLLELSFARGRGIIFESYPSEKEVMRALAGPLHADKLSFIHQGDLRGCNIGWPCGTFAEVEDYDVRKTLILAMRIARDRYDQEQVLVFVARIPSRHRSPRTRCVC